jgi:hypothetical protein
MTRDLIEELALGLPADNPYYQEAFRNEPEKLQSSSPAQRLAVALGDPGFGWHIAQVHAPTGMPPPQLNWPPAVHQAYAFLRNPNSTDRNMAIVQQLNLPEGKRRRDVLRPVLVCRDNTLEQIAELFHLRLEVLNLFEELTWNCRHRCAERLYLAQICQMPGFARVAGWGRETFDPGCELLQIAYQVGRTQVVLAAAGLASAHPEDISAQALQNHIVDSILDSVLEGLEAEKVAKSDNPLLEPVLGFVASRQKEQAQAQATIQRPSLANAIRRTFEVALAEPQPTPGTQPNRSAG